MTLMACSVAVCCVEALAAQGTGADNYATLYTRCYTVGRSEGAKHICCARLFSGIHVFTFGSYYHSAQKRRYVCFSQHSQKSLVFSWNVSDVRRSIIEG